MYQSLNSTLKRWLGNSHVSLTEAEVACVRCFLVPKRKVHCRCLIKMDMAIKWALGSAWYKFLLTLTWLGPYFLRNTDVCQVLPWLKDCHIHQRVLCFNIHVFITLTFLCCVIHLTISLLRIVQGLSLPQQRIVEGLSTPYPLIAFLA